MKSCKIILIITTAIITFLIKYFKMIIDGDVNHIKLNE